MNEENKRYFNLNLPHIDLKVRKFEGEIQVFDPFRDRYVALTPEEVVRQHFAAWLVSFLHCPESHIANEVPLTYNGMDRRADTLVSDSFGKPLIVVEYKAPSVKITQDVFDQIARYNSVFKARYLAVSNGINHYFCVMKSDGSYDFIPRLPDYNVANCSFSEN